MPYDDFEIVKKLADLEKRLASVERLTTPLIPLGPRRWTEDDQKGRDTEVKRISEHIVRELGWYCDNCKNVHGPHMGTCPEPPNRGSLAERVKGVSNG